MKDYDLFIRSIKENPPLKSAFFSWLDAMRVVWLEEMATVKGIEALSERQGAIMGLKRMKSNLQEMTSGAIDQPRTGAN